MKQQLQPKHCWVNQSYWLPGTKVEQFSCQLIFDKIFPKNATFKLLAMSNDELNFFYPFLHSTHQECMIFARIGTGSCYYHWHEICAGVIGHIWSNNRLLNEVGELCIANQAVIHGKEFIQNNACLLPFCTNHKLHLFLRRGPDFFFKLQYVLEWLFPLEFFFNVKVAPLIN